MDRRGLRGRQYGSFWRVNAPPGFVALGDVACNNWSQPTPEFTAKYACIRQDLLSADAELSSTALLKTCVSKKPLASFNVRFGYTVL